MAKLLREALTECGSLRAVERATGVLRQSMMTFLAGKSLRLDNADKLAEYFGIECRRRERRKGR